MGKEEKEEIDDAALFGQATHTLTIIGQHEPTADDLRLLHDGYLTDVIRAIKNRTIPARLDFQKLLGLRPEFSTWRTIKLGTGLKSADGFRDAIKVAGCKIGDWASDILGKPAFTQGVFTATDAETTITLDLVNVSVAELGFPKQATYQEICDRGLEFDLALCPAEVGPQLRIQYLDQPKGEWLRVAMEAIRGSDGRLLIWLVERDGGGLWLGADDGHPDDVWRADRRFVFCRRKVALSTQILRSQTLDT